MNQICLIFWVTFYRKNKFEKRLFFDFTGKKKHLELLSRKKYFTEYLFFFSTWTSIDSFLLVPLLSKPTKDIHYPIRSVLWIYSKTPRNFILERLILSRNVVTATPFCPFRLYGWTTTTVLRVILKFKINLTGTGTLSYIFKIQIKKGNFWGFWVKGMIF